MNCKQKVALCTFVNVACPNTKGDKIAERTNTNPFLFNSKLIKGSKNCIALKNVTVHLKIQRKIWNNLNVNKFFWIQNNTMSSKQE